MLTWFTEAGGTVAIAAVTWHELWLGVARLPAGHRRDALDAFVVGLAVESWWSDPD